MKYFLEKDFPEQVLFYLFSLLFPLQHFLSFSSSFAHNKRDRNCDSVGDV